MNWVTGESHILFAFKNIQPPSKSLSFFKSGQGGLTISTVFFFLISLGQYTGRGEM